MFGSKYKECYEDENGLDFIVLTDISVEPLCPLFCHLINNL